MANDAGASVTGGAGVSGGRLGEFLSALFSFQLDLRVEESLSVTAARGARSQSEHRLQTSGITVTRRCHFLQQASAVGAAPRALTLALSLNPKASGRAALR